MNRRSFLKSILALLGLLITAGGGLLAWLDRGRLAASAEPAAAAPQQPIPSPTGGDQLAEETATAGPGEPLMSMFVISDLHISLDDPQTSRKLKQALEDMKAFHMPIDALVITGDLTDTGSDRDYKELTRILSGYKLPPLGANMGNHDFYTVWINKNGGWDKDHYPNGKSDAVSREQFMKLMNYKKTYNEMKVKGYTVLLLSQEAYIQEKPEVGEGAWYSDEQLAWFKERMAEAARDGKPVFVMTHQPLPPIGENGGTHQLIRAKEFREILKPYKNVFVLCGHRHQDFMNGTNHYVRETFHYFHNSSVGRPLNRNYQQQAKDHAQGMYVQVYADKVVLRGREFETRTFIDEANWTIPLEKTAKKA
ncbi:phosphohydrolase [Gordoniibacillus kamchatkensis]|uniref:Phosphohydrolase n=1 Tax=Gordoniibacillus kamchatkensis TaxID=1590651 RepID=A0ABR5ANK3_9BACL|nr:phosphohydrolase [Paenibacillus sp. VKM B-2647]